MVLFAYDAQVGEGNQCTVPAMLRKHMPKFKDLDVVSVPKIPAVKVPEVLSGDLETTGFSPENDHIFEIGCVSSFGPRFQIFIKVEVPLVIQELTGVTQAEVDAEGVTLLEACEAFKKWLSERSSDAVWAGHRFRAFDFRFLLHAYKKCGFEAPIFPQGGLVDTFEWASDLKLSKKKLGDMYKLASGGENLVGAHRATTDAEAVIKILFSEWAGLRWWPTEVKPLRCFADMTRKRKREN